MGVALVLVCACGPAPGSPAALGNAVAPPAAPSLADALAAEVGAGRSVAIIGGPGGLRALSSDGARSRTLVPGAIAWVVVDPRASVVWFGPDERSIRAIDLLAPASAPPMVTTVVDGLPSHNGMPSTAVVYPSPEPGISEGEAAAMGETFAVSPEIGAFGGFDAHRVFITINAAPAITAASSMRDSQEAWEAEVGKARIAAPAFLAMVRARPDQRRPREQPAARAAPPALPGFGPPECERDDCGSITPIAGTHYGRVLVAARCDDVCGERHQLYDLDARAFIEGPWADQVDRSRLAPDGSGFLRDGVVYQFASGALATTPPFDYDTGQGGGALGGDWLGGSDSLL